jgi:threonine/homoserine/homoserine lactone efflux protein
MLILIAAGLIVVIASILALAAPTVLARDYQLWSRLSYYFAAAGLAWIAIGAVRSLNTILQVLEDEGVTADSGLHTIRMLAYNAVNEQHVYVPALLALIIAGVYLEVLGRNRARSLRGNAA